MLVGIPLIFGIVFLSVLFCGLSEANRLVQNELQMKDAMISMILASRCNGAAKMCAFGYLTTHDPFLKERYEQNKKRAIAADAHLRKLLKDKRGFRIPPLLLSTEQLFAMGPSAIAAPTQYLLPLQRVCDREAKAAMEAMNRLQIILYGGMAAGTLITILLALFFCLNITNRLLIIVHNTVSLSKGTALSPPMAGSDEIAELDQFLYKSATEIRALERFKKEMIGVVSHELKSPLTSVGAFLSSLGEGVFGELSVKAQDKVKRTYSSVKRLMGLVSELLYLDRLELEMSPEEIKIEELLSVSVDTVKELAEPQGIKIDVRSSGGTVHADRNRMVQVIVNLLSNALKFSPPEGQVIVDAGIKDGWFECRVSDQGRGIPEEFRKQIFEPFKQVDAKDATAKKGTGLGLTISRSIVEQHGGKIGVDSEEGKGTTFWFQIPATAILRTKIVNVPQGPAGGSVTLSKSELPSESLQSGKKGSGEARKFSVLHQGLVIISVPLIFQFVFVAIIACMLNQVTVQAHREENSKEVLNLLNEMSEVFTRAVNQGMMYAYTGDPVALHVWESGKKEGLEGLSRAEVLSVADPEQKKNLNESRAAVARLSDMLMSEAARNENKAEFRKMMETLGRRELGAQGVIAGRAARGITEDLAYNVKKNLGLDQTGHPLPDSAQGEGPAARSPDTGLSSERQSLNRIVGAMAQAGGGTDGLGAMGIMGQFQSFLTSSIQAKLVRPFLEVQESQDRLMKRERSTGKKLANQRAAMINLFQQTLFAGIGLSIGLSVFLAVILMRSLTNRLHHVMENTARLVKREALEPPEKGSDEIAYLDRVLCETGKRLIELENFKRQLISIVSHELRTPLMAVSSTFELFQSGALGDLSDKGKNRLAFAQEETERLIRLISDLLDIEKMEAGKFVLDISKVNVTESIQAAISGVTQLAEAKQIKMESDIPGSIESIFADGDRLRQVLINLLSNAIKFSPESGIIKVKVEKLGTDQLKLSVADQGRGIPEEMKQKVFDRFTQVEKADATERGGSGLGLAISKAIVEQHGGTIGVDSAPWAGSTFWFLLPIKQCPTINGPKV